MQERKLLLSVHIEKTAGTSLQRSFEDAFEKDSLLLYNPRQDQLIRNADVKLRWTNGFLDKFRQQVGNHEVFSFFSQLYSRYIFAVSRSRAVDPENIPDDIRVIHGHFVADKFDSYIAKPMMAIVVRDPLPRMRSQFEHWKQAEGKADWRVTVEYDPNMTFADYAFHPSLRNYQVNALGGKDLDSFRFVGTTNNFNGFVQNMLTDLIIEGFCPLSINALKSPGRINKSPPPRYSTPIPASFLEEFKHFHADDYVLYERATEKSKHNRLNI